MKERPILFSSPMVRAILDDSKRQTRRLVIPQPDPRYTEIYTEHGHPAAWWWSKSTSGRGAEQQDMRLIPSCPHGNVDDRLWVREGWRVEATQDNTRPRDIPQGEYAVDYAAKPDMHAAFAGKWRPSIHMCRWMSRITLEITVVRVERLQDISEGDAVAEGCEAQYGRTNAPMDPPEYDGHSAREEFIALWDGLNVKRAPWADNSWVWVIQFKHLKG